MENHNYNDEFDSNSSSSFFSCYSEFDNNLNNDLNNTNRSDTCSISSLIFSSELFSSDSDSDVDIIEINNSTIDTNTNNTTNIDITTNRTELISSEILSSIDFINTNLSLSTSRVYQDITSSISSSITGNLYNNLKSSITHGVSSTKNVGKTILNYGDYISDYISAQIYYSSICSEYYKRFMSKISHDSSILLIGISSFDSFISDELRTIIVNKNFKVVCIESDDNLIKKAKHKLIDLEIDYLNFTFLHVDYTYETNDDTIVKCIEFNDGIKVIHRKFDVIFYDIQLTNLLSKFKLFKSHCSDFTYNVLFGFMINEYNSYNEYVSSSDTIKLDIVSNIDICKGRISTIENNTNCQDISIIIWKY